MSEVEMEQESSPEPEEVKPIAGIGTLVFGKWDASQVTCKDPGLAPLHQPHNRWCPAYWRTTR